MRKKRKKFLTEGAPSKISERMGEGIGRVASTTQNKIRNQKKRKKKRGCVKEPQYSVEKEKNPGPADLSREKKVKWRKG